MKALYISLAVLALGVFAIVLVGVVLYLYIGPLPAPATRPSVVIQSPPSGSEFKVGQDLAVQSLSSDPQGIRLVELYVDGTPVRSNLAPVGQPTPQLSLSQTWNPGQSGQHVITVRATNAHGIAGEAAINLTFVNPVIATATPFATSPAEATVAPTLGTQNPSGGGCSMRADFVADVTIPDGTTVPASSSFVKTWRVKNSGCAWNSGFTLVWTAGEQMGATSPSLIPLTTSGSVVDLSIPMVAPAAAGAHVGEWRLRSPDGALFGNKLTVVINVPAAPTTETPTAVPTEPPPPEETATPTPTPPPTDPPAPQPTVPAAPSTFSANGTGTTIHFSWTDNSNNELGFRIYQVGQVAPVATRTGNTGTGGVALDWAGRPCNLNATFYVKAYNPVGESNASNNDAAVTIPCAPAGFHAVGSGASSMTVSFTDNATNESGFHVYRIGEAAVLKTFSAHAATGGFNGTVNPLSCGQSHNLYVKAFNSAGESTASNQDAGTTSACTVTVTFQSIHVNDDTDSSGAGDIWLSLHVNGQSRRWPNSGTIAINSGETKTLSGVAVTQNLMRAANLTISVTGTDEDPFIDDSLGTYSATLSGSQNWNEGSHCRPSSSGKFQICYNVSVTP